MWRLQLSSSLPPEFNCFLNYSDVFHAARTWLELKSQQSQWTAKRKHVSSKKRKSLLVLSKWNAALMLISSTAARLLLILVPPTVYRMRCHPGKRLRRFLSEVGEKDELLESKRTSCCPRITSANCASSCWAAQLDGSKTRWVFSFIVWEHFLKSSDVFWGEKTKCSSVALKWWSSTWRDFCANPFQSKMAWVYFGWVGGPPPATVTLSEKLENEKVKPRELWMINFS